MEAVAIHSLNLRCFSMRLSFTFSKHCYSGNSSISMQEVSVQSSHYVFQRAAYKFPNSSIRSDGEKGGQTSRRNENKRPQFFRGNNKSNSSDQEEIIALFKRIQSSISKRDLQNTSKTSSNIESILDILGEPKKQMKGKISNRTKGKDLTNRGDESRKEAPSPDFELSRPPSNFIKKSPIPFLSTPRPRGKIIELNNEELASIVMEDKQVHSERIEELKVAELKELAKSRGVKGYSKLKKSELIQILCS